MDSLTQSLKNSLKTIVDTFDNIELIIAYSGGIDSQVLLHALMQLKQKKLIYNDVTVCHVNHGLSKNAEKWQHLAEQECAKLSVKLIVKCVNVKPQAQQSLEALARDARYDALKSIREKQSVILTGHHSDDQTETFLLALKRGAGLKGLSAMAKSTPMAQHLLVRPLLDVSRHEIEQYAKTHALTWVEDESNSDTSFDRNFIRQEVIPLLRERWPSINNTVNRSAMHCSAGQELLDELAEQDLVISQRSGDSLDISALKLLSPARFNNLIRFFMAQHHCLMPSTEQLNQVREQLKASDDKTPQIKVADKFFRRFKDKLYLTPDYQDVSSWQSNVELFSENGGESEKGSERENIHNQAATLTLPDNLGELVFSLNDLSSSAMPVDKPLPQALTQLPNIALPTKEQNITVRFSHHNPKCLPHFRQHSRSVKKVLQELSIAPWQRKRIAFLYYDDELVAAIGHFVCKPFIATENQLAINISLL